MVLAEELQVTQYWFHDGDGRAHLGFFQNLFSPQVAGLAQALQVGVQLLSEGTEGL